MSMHNEFLDIYPKNPNGTNNYYRNWGKTMRIILSIHIVILALGINLLSPKHAKAGQACERQDIVPLLVDTVGSAQLCISPRGIKAKMKVRQLVPGDAYTVWWVYFDDPSACAIPGQCGDPDFGGDNPLAVFGRMDSIVAPGNGRVILSGQVRGMRPSSGAQIELLMFGHGPVDETDGRHLARQLLTPEDPAAGAPHLGNNVDGPLGFPAAVVRFTAP